MMYIFTFVRFYDNLRSLQAYSVSNANRIYNYSLLVSLLEQEESEWIELYVREIYVMFNECMVWGI